LSVTATARRYGPHRLFDNGEAIVAYGQAATSAFPLTWWSSVKRQMGNDSWRFYPTVVSYTPEDLGDHPQRITSDASQCSVTDRQVVITVPAILMTPSAGDQGCR